jgi:uncharacterized tellurite resistance protein B-like protein
MKLKKLSREDRMKLMKFICSFAWADLEVRTEERQYVARMIVRLHLDEDEAAQVQRWLDIPPRPEEVDPNAIPHAHRKLFLEAAREMIGADGEISEEEEETLELLEQLVR